MNQIHQRIEVDSVDFKVPYSGYLWYSNASAPRMLENEQVSKENFTSLPFVIEAMLLSADRQSSISIKNVDAKYYVYRTDLAQLSPEQLTPVTYLSHRTPGFTRYQMIEYWEEQPSHGVEGFPSLQPVWTAFYGLIS
jgi:CRISPR type III-associated protein (TIGR04423 family)